MNKPYDAIVIGSGIAGLTFAAVMSKVGRKRVLLLERHFKPGGWEWDVGLHYVGEMAEGSTGRNLFDLVTNGTVRWNPMPDAYNHFHYPGLRFNARKGEASLREDLIARLPEEARAIGKYFRDVKSARA